MKGLNISEPYSFVVAPSISEQVFRFHYEGKSIEVSADYTTPLYETIAEIVDHDCYQLKSINFDRVKNPIILDIGANIGVSALVLSCIPGATVYCFEPILQNCKRLEDNIRRNAVSTIQVIPKAVSKTDGKIKLEMIPDQSVSAHVRFNNGDNPHVESIEVDSISFNNILKTLNIREIDLIKLDCEGGEYDILDQLSKDLADRIRYISLEVHDLSKEQNFGTLSRRLEGLGYTLKYNREVFGRSGLNHLLAYHS